MMAWPAAKIQKTCKSAAVKIHMAMLSSIERLGEIRRYLRMRQSSPSHCIAKLHRPTPGVLIIPDREPHCCQPVNKKSVYIPLLLPKACLLFQFCLGTLL